jgi:hypothetical protein
MVFFLWSLSSMPSRGVRCPDALRVAWKPENFGSMRPQPFLASDQSRALRTVDPGRKIKNNIFSTRRNAAMCGRLQIGTMAGFNLECMAGFNGIRTASFHHVLCRGG